MKLKSFDCGYFKLDGGAMFGVVPKKIWQKLIPPDENNLCNWSMRCLLVESGNRKILIDCGMGTKQEAKFFSHYEPSGNISVDASLEQMQLRKEDITDVFLTHLHFDHCGGAVELNADGKLVPTFPNATYWSNEKHWQWAEFPNAREKASFLKENFIPLREHGVVKFLKDDEELIPGFQTILVHGHTESMMLPKINTGNKTIVYMADLLPSYAHIPLPYVMGYDVRPLQTLKEKESFLNTAINENYYLIFEHDAMHEACDLIQTEKGIRHNTFYSISDL